MNQENEMDWEDDGEIETKHKPEKVYITIEPGRRFVESVHNGCEFTSVGYSGRIYGGTSPCITDEDINKAVEWAKETIKREGDIPVVQDSRIKQDLSKWF